MLDILIQNAQIVDGTGAPGYRGDVAVAGDSIVDVGHLPGAVAGQVIDATDRLVVPGFIDMHSHADLSLPAAPEGESLVQQGITTVVAGQCGLSPAPLPTRQRKLILTMLNTLVPPQAEMPWDQMATFESYLACLERARPAVNVVPLVGQGMVRAAVMGLDAGRPTAGQMAEMQRLVHEALDAGAFGLSTGLIYPPGSFSTTDELVEVTRPAAERGRLYFSHVRGEADTLLDAYREAIEIGRRAGLPVQIAHVKAAGRKNWDKAAQALDLIDGARAEGLDVTADMYPYLAGSTLLGALLPRWAIEGSPLAILGRLLLPWQRQRIVADMRAGRGEAVSEIEWDGVLISKSRRPEMVGRYVSELAAEAGQDGYTWTLNTLLRTLGDAMMVIFLMSEENVRLQLQHPALMIGTDGLGLAVEGPMSEGMLHPRSFGTYPRLFGHYVRREGLLSAAEASWKASGFPAQKLGLADRGTIKKGNKADLVILDPATVDDRATYTEPLHYPAGIDWVLVNGQVVVQGGRQTPARPGLVLRR